MKIVVRLCIAFAMHALTGAHAGLETVWSQRFTSASETYTVQATRFDPARDVIVAGTITDAETKSDLWVTKLNGKTGKEIWTFRKDGMEGGADKLGDIAIADNGDVYVAGALVNAPPNAGESGTDAYLARLRAGDGAIVWEVDGLGNVGDDAWHAIALDESFNPVVTGVIVDRENNLGGEIWTAKFDAANREMMWDATHFAFETTMLDQGERIFVAPNGDVYVQGFHSAGTYLETNYQPTVQVLSYETSGKFRFATRFREAPNGRAYGFAPSPSGGFIVGLSAVSPFANIPIITVASGKADGTFGTEASLPSVSVAPSLALAANDDVLFTGREVQSTGEINAVAGRLAAEDFAPHWVRRIPAPGTGPGIGFAHADYLEGGSAVAAIVPGPSTPDLALATFSKEGDPQGLPLILDGGVAEADVTDFPPSGPAMDTDEFGGVLVAVAPIGVEGEREVLVRRLRVVSTGTPTISLTSPDPADPNVDAFTEFRIAAAASDPEGGALSVEFFADGVSIGTVAPGPFEIAHTFLSTGVHTIEAVASNAAGATASTGPVTVVAHVPTPVVATGGARRAGPDTGQFFGTVSNLPLGGTARFVFGFSGPTVGFGFSTETIELPPSMAGQLVIIPFTFPQPHRSYDYFLEVTTTDGNEVVTAGSAAQSFLIPNAPVLATPDFVFLSRGAITGNPQLNDLDDDAGEALVVTYGGGPFPGTFVTKGNAFTFTPSRDFTGELVIPYTVDDGHGSLVTETLVIRNAIHYAGNYRALTPVDSPNLGAVDVTVNRAGRATAVVYLNGARFKATGELTQQENDTVGFSAVIRKRLQPDRHLLLSWAANRQLTAELGVILEEPPSFQAEISPAALPPAGFQVLYTARGTRAGISTFPVPQLYTLLGTHTNVSGNAAGRVTAFASMQVAPNGKTLFRGKLGDATPFVAKTQVREDGQLPIYVGLQGRSTSFLLGLMQPGEIDGTSVMPGLIAVQGPPTKTTPAYAADYRDRVAFSGPRYVPPGVGGSALAFTTVPRRLTLSVTGGGINAGPLSLPVWLGRTGGVSGITGITRFSVSAKTGEVSGAFLPDGRRRTLPFSGVLRPNDNEAVGIFRGPTAMGEVQLAPE